MNDEHISINNNFSGIKNKSKIIFYPISVESFFSSERYNLETSFPNKKYIWNLKKASYFIETILLNFPIPSIITCYDYNKSKEDIIDGFQRLKSIQDFLNGRYALTGITNLSSLNGFKYSSLPTEFQNTIKQYILNVTLIQNITDTGISDIYKRLNSCKQNKNFDYYYESPDLNDLINEMLTYKEFEKVFDNSNISKEERVEFLLRFVALYENFNSYNGNINDLTKLYINNNLTLTPEKKRKLILTYKNTFDACQVIFKEDAFKNCINLKTPNGIRNIMYKSLSKPVFEMQMLGVADLDFGQIYRKASLIKEQYELALNSDENFRPYYKKMSRRAVEYRINKWRTIVKNIIKY